MLDQMRNGIARLLKIDCDIGMINRNGEPHTVECRMSYQSGVVWDYAGVDGGANITTTPYVFAEHDADIAEGDILIWRDRKFQIGAVSKPTLDGGNVCLQAQLREVQNG